MTPRMVPAQMDLSCSGDQMSEDETSLLYSGWTRLDIYMITEMLNLSFLSIIVAEEEV